MAKKESKKVVAKKSAAEKIRELNNAEIETKIAELKQELFQLRLQAAVGKLENTAQIRQLKTVVAQAKTLIKEKSEVK